MVLANIPLSNWAFVSANENFVSQFDYDVNGNLIYQGWAQPGTLTTDVTWRIKQFNYNGSNQLTSIAFPQDANGNPSCAFGFQWSIRTSYVYS